jgi:hypothetical protein
MPNQEKLDVEGGKSERKDSTKDPKWDPVISLPPCLLSSRAVRHTFCCLCVSRRSPRFGFRCPNFALGFGRQLISFLCCAF